MAGIGVILPDGPLSGARHHGPPWEGGHSRLRGVRSGHCARWPPFTWPPWPGCATAR